MKQNAAFFQRKDAVVESSKAISQRCRAARKSGFLNLSSNNLRELPESVFGEQQLDPDEKYWECEPVHKVDLSFNQLTRLPATIGQMGVDLVILIIRSNELSSVPMELFDCTKLRVIDLSSNKLTALGDGFNKLVDLRELHLNDNELRCLPDSLQYCVNLSSLNVSNNRLSSLPNFVCCGRQQSRFKSINASNNCIVSLSTEQPAGGEVVIAMPFLESFDLQRNQLGGATLVFCACPAVSYINLSENKLASCPIISDCPKLSRMHLSNNRIGSFDFPRTRQRYCADSGLFGPSGSLGASLVELHVNNNCLTAVPDDIVYCLALKVLDVSNNNIGDLNCCLGFIKSLQRVAVEGNPIRTIRRTVLTESTVNLKTYLRSRCADPTQVLQFETVQNMQEDPAVRKSLLTEAVGGSDGEDAVVVQRARDATGGVLDLSGLRLETFPVYIVPSLYRCDAISNTNNGSGNLRGVSNSQAGRRYAANTQKQGLHGFGGSAVADYNNSVIEDAKVLCVTEVNLADNRFPQLPAELHALGGGGSGYDHDAAVGITSLNLSHNQLGSAVGPRGQSSGRSPLAVAPLPAGLEHLDVSNNSLGDPDLQIIVSSCVAGANAIGARLLALRVLVLSNNRLQSFLPSSLLGACAGLRELQMAHNALTSLDHVPFGELRSLEIVNFADNRLTSVGRLWEARKLRTVMLDNNNLQNVPPELALLADLSALSIHGNPQKGVRFDILQKGTEAVLQCLRNKLAAPQVSAQQLADTQRGMSDRLPQPVASEDGNSSHSGGVSDHAQQWGHRGEGGADQLGRVRQQQQQRQDHVFSHAPPTHAHARAQVVRGYNYDAPPMQQHDRDRQNYAGDGSQSLASFQQNRLQPASTGPAVVNTADADLLKAEIQKITERLECSSLTTMKSHELKRELVKKRAALARMS